MSRAWGLVRFNDGEIWHGLYNGTVDIFCSPLFETYEELSDYWELESRYFVACNCNDKEGEEVEIYSNYGGGFYWKGKACRKCKCLTNGFNTDGLDEKGDFIREDGKPAWAIEFMLKEEE